MNNILIVEDDRFIGEMYVRSLRKAGYTVDWVVDGEDGLVAARNKSYDAILLDLMLPEKRGNDVLRELRNDKEDLIPDTKVIVLTNFVEDDESREEMQRHADGYLIKAEITPRALIEALKGFDS